jgi:hypothetical protein
METMTSAKEQAELSTQTRTIAKLKVDGWVVVEPQVVVEDGSVLMSLTRPGGVSHIVIMLNGDRVDARQKLGKQAPVPDAGEPSGTVKK